MHLWLPLKKAAMKFILYVCLSVSLITETAAQNVGIGLEDPAAKLSVNGPILIDQYNTFNGTWTNGSMLRFGLTGGAGIGSIKVSADLRHGLSFYTKTISRMNIDSIGDVSIGTNNVSMGYRLYVDGDTYTRGYGRVSDGLMVGTAVPHSGYRFEVDGQSRLDGDTKVLGTADVDALMVRGTSTFSDDAVYQQGLTVQSGRILVRNKGTVINSNSAELMFYNAIATVTYTNAPAGYSDDVTVSIPAGLWSSAPKILVGGIRNATGTFERWTYTVHSIDNSSHTCQIRFYNASSLSSSMSITLDLVCLGPSS